MVDGAWAVGAADVGHAPGVAHAGQQRLQCAAMGALFVQRLQLVVDAVEGKFAVIDQQQTGRSFVHDLAAQFAANAAPGAGHHHHLACQVVAQQAG